jgi:hypothetical protein
MRYHLLGITEKEILFQTDDIEKYLNNNLYKYDFGTSINSVFFSYDIFDFDKCEQHIDNEKKYQYGKKKDLCIMEQYNGKLLKNMIKIEQLIYLREGMLGAISRIEAMSGKPKDFNVQEFYKTIDKLMSEYEENNA